MAPPGINIELTAETDTSAITIPSAITISGINKRRTAAGKLHAGVAAWADIEAFKGHSHHHHKKLAKRWDCKSLQKCVCFP